MFRQCNRLRSSLSFVCCTCMVCTTQTLGMKQKTLPLAGAHQHHTQTFCDLTSMKDRQATKLQFDLINATWTVLDSQASQCHWML